MTTFYFTDHTGNLRCADTKAFAPVPTEFCNVLIVLAADLQLALECIDAFGAVPIPVAEAILRNIEPAHAAIDMAVRAARTSESEAN